MHRLQYNNHSYRYYSHHYHRIVTMHCNCSRIPCNLVQWTLKDICLIDVWGKGFNIKK